MTDRSSGPAAAALKQQYWWNSAVVIDGPKQSTNERLELVRTLVVEAALEVLDQDGLGLQAESISYAKVFALLGEHGLKVSRGSVHGRIWDSHDDFRTEVLTGVINHTAPTEFGNEVDHTVLSVLELLDERHPDLDQQHRITAFSRMTGHALLTGYLHSDRFKRFQAIKAAASGAGDNSATTELRSMIRRQTNDNRAGRSQIYEQVFGALGLRGRQELGLSDAQAIDLFISILQVLISGSHLDHHAGFSAMASKVETDLLTDEDQPWTYFGVGVLACIRMFFEPEHGAESRRFRVGELTGEHGVGSVPPIELSGMVTSKPRRTREELRELVVAAGVQLFLQDGTGLRPEALSYASVFSHIRETRGIAVHRSTVHPAIWSSQEEFRADVLAEATRYGGGESLVNIRQAMAAQTVTRNPDGSVNVRQLILDNSLATVDAQMTLFRTSPAFRRWQAIKASMLSRTPEENADDLRLAVNQRYEELLTAYNDTYRSVLPLVGLTPNPELLLSDDQAYHLFTVLCATIATGADFDSASGALCMEQRLPVPRVDASGEVDQWSIPALASLAMLDLLFVSTSD